MSKKNDVSKKKKSPAKAPPIKGPARNAKILAGFFIATVVLILAYWIVFYTAGVLIPADVENFRDMRAAQLLGSIWIVIILTACAIELLREKEASLLWGMLVGGALVLAALYNIHFNIVQGVYAVLGIPMVVEAAGNLFTVILGLVTINYFWKNAEQIMSRKLALSLPVKKKRI